MPPPVSTSQAGPSDIGLDGEKIKDMTYYNLLDVRGDVSFAELKKAYKKKALLYHPDKNPGNAEAADKFLAVSKAMQVLSNSQSRAIYDRGGSMPEGTGVDDPGKFFSDMFGGEAFLNWIGEISLGKDIGKAFDITTTPEQKAQMRKEWIAAQDPPVTSSEPTVAEGTGTNANDASPVTKPTKSGTPSTTKANDSTASSLRPKLTPDQHAELAKYERQRREEQLQRVYNLSMTLIQRLQPFVDAKKGKNVSEGSSAEKKLEQWEKGIREEADELKIASFGVELLQLIGSVYVKKANTYIKLHQPKWYANFLGLPKFYENTKQTGKDIKEIWGVLNSTLDAQSAFQQYDKLPENNELSEAELEAMNRDLTGKFLLVSWRGTRLESSTILREVVDQVLSKVPPRPPPASISTSTTTPEVLAITSTPEDSTSTSNNEGSNKHTFPPSKTTSDPPSSALSPSSSPTTVTVDQATLLLRAEALRVIGQIFKQVQVSDLDEERREHERLVAEASNKKKSKTSSSNVAAKSSSKKQQQQQQQQQAGSAKGTGMENGSAAATSTTTAPISATG